MAEVAQKRAPIAGLDLLRFFAAMLVMVFHLAAASWAAPATATAQIVAGAAKYPELLNFTSSGYVGVEIFFVLSGVVIAYAAAAASPSTFLRNRMLRLYPAVWICAPLSTIVLWRYGVVSTHQFIRGYIDSALLLPFGPWADVVYWTLGIEMAFYAVIFGLLAIGSFGQITIVCSMIGSVSAAYWIVGWLAAPSFLMAHLWNRWLDLSLVTYGIYFALGILLYSMRTSGVSLIKIGFGTMLLVAAAIEIFYKARYAAIVFNSTLPATLPIVIFLAAMGAGIASLYWDARPGIARTLRFVGLATYPLYLIHDYCGAAVLQMTGGRLGINRFLSLGITLVVCVTTSMLIAAIAEPPIRQGFCSFLEIVSRLGRRLLRRAKNFELPLGCDGVPQVNSAARLEV
jgi:peptidoglycan/LPS O-acetylase OafA/YrhL